MPSRRQIRSTGNCALTLLLRIAMLVAAWQGPVPWWHSHAGFGDGRDNESRGLSEHVQRYHPSVNVQTAAEFTWHMHVVLPGRPLDVDSETPTYPSPDRLPMTSTHDVEQSIGSAISSLPDAWNVELADRPLAATCRDAELRDRPSQFFDGSKPSLRLTLRFCVDRC